MTVLKPDVPTAAPYVDATRARTHRPSGFGGPRDAWAAITAKREMSLGVRYLATVGPAMLAFAPALAMIFDAAVKGSPTAYLLFVPVWGLMIAFGLDVSSRGRDIGDTEFDRILVVVVGGALGLTAALVIPRIPAVAAFWHADVIPLLLWVFAASIVTFGIRRVVRDYLVWLFILICFPPNFLLVGQMLGGTTAVFGSLTVGLGLVVTYMSLRAHVRVALITAAVAGVVGFALVAAFDDTPALAYSVPAGAVTAIAIVVRLRAGRTEQQSPAVLPKQTVVGLTAGWLVALVILGVAPHPQNAFNPDGPPLIADDWVTQLRAEGMDISDPRLFDWGSGVMGSDGDVRRYRVTPSAGTGAASTPLTAAYLDVYSTADYGRFANYRRGLWYETVPPASITSTPSSVDEQHREIGVIANTLDAVRTSDDALWTGRFWGWRVQTAGGDRYMAVYLMAARDQSRTEEVATPRAPSYSTTVTGPLGWLVRGGGEEDGMDADSSALDTALTELAWSMIRSVERPMA
ncbi:hypothetical protein GDN83_09255 [Gordonia jinghuaiqii]|uniref:Uncharacterized protein n=1 Tax=Gordonia jinghuaiqii TaxID=2758710 RepID=A0A7D7RRQ9_9ACTN|nr:hypothetical protein [Gordonia jinghuaiqii]MCR5977916.1 hypothetical protein [Gordonia jinghuaiqii]QMT02573.1 hypothetical protein H1R19_05315 [Gordonia jinghuaiqii]